MYYFFCYITCGIIFNLLIDLLIWTLIKHGYANEDIMWGTYVKIVVTLLWPAALILFIYTITDEIIKKQ